MSKRSEALAARLEAGVKAMTELAMTLSDAEWQTRVVPDGRKVGVVVHHVANLYPIEIELAQALASGKPIEGVTWDAIHVMNADHAKQQDAVTRETALALLAKNSAAAAAGIRAFSDTDLDAAAPISLKSNAPLTCQFFVEDHAVSHAYHHLAKIRATLGR